MEILEGDFGNWLASSVGLTGGIARGDSDYAFMRLAGGAVGEVGGGENRNDRDDCEQRFLQRQVLQIRSLSIISQVGEQGKSGESFCSGQRSLQPKNDAVEEAEFALLANLRDNT